jgi:hypothetical protein
VLPKSWKFQLGRSIEWSRHWDKNKMEANFHSHEVALEPDFDPSMDSVAPIVGDIGSVQESPHKLHAKRLSRHAAERSLKGVLAAISAKHVIDQASDEASKPFVACAGCGGTRLERQNILDGLPLYANRACRVCNGSGRQC